MVRKKFRGAILIAFLQMRNKYSIETAMGGGGRTIILFFFDLAHWSSSHSNVGN